ncbi:hypothetical protein N656DRAFT_705614 [Canariomyces notabilis]|uniref:Copper acquisition factor BIM1-like domain-containing protein n=1 Tax=Canariomyces notabilis TaxID=2074819 RepID=A0AAN6YUK0_9PEZI|nr:hypothetical protein N656DRAFT_705614 [Canariomyces arenarius]
MAPFQPVLFLAGAAVAIAASNEMGPAAFMWPPDRAWSEQMDNTPPCGSVALVTNRTKFPLTGGKVALVAQDDSYRAQLSISFSNDPQTQSDFGYVLNTAPIAELDPGHTCLDIPNPPSTIAPGTNATIQIIYTADFDRPENQTFYACADITYVTDFNPANIPCFNSTVPEDVPAPTSTGIPTNLPGHGDEGPPLELPSSEPSSVPVTDGPGARLSSGAIAGVVVGVVVGLGLIAGLAFLFYRERQRKNRLIRQRDSARGVKWVEDPAKDSVSAETIRMGNMS